MGDIATRSAGLFFTAILLASALAIAAAAVAARLFGTLDCAAYMCQLAPYGLAAVIAGMALLAGPGVVGYRGAAIACAVVFAAGCAVSLFREGMQQGWWTFAGFCDELTPSPPGSRWAAFVFDRSIAALCDARETTPDGFAFATVNFVYSAMLAFVCAVMAAVNDFGRAEPFNV